MRLKKKTVNRSLLLASALLAFTISSCKEEIYTPKPKGFFRIDLPEKNYSETNLECPYSFEIPQAATCELDLSKNAEPCWVNIVYPIFKGEIHISYKPVKNNLPLYIEDARKLTSKHIPKADMIEENVIYDEQRDVYGLIYDVQGTGAASTMQFYITDSTQHFLRGALYFNIEPNNDSLAPVIDYIKEDIVHLISTVEWEE